MVPGIPGLPDDRGAIAIDATVKTANLVFAVLTEWNVKVEKPSSSPVKTRSRLRLQTVIDQLHYRSLLFFGLGE
jgi:hypothetical protein